MYGLGSKDGPPMTIPVDPQLSFRWYLAAAKQGVVKAMMKIGHLYYLGRGVVKKDESTLEWYTKAAEMGNQVGQYNLGYSKIIFLRMGCERGGLFKMCFLILDRRFD